ncbi:electron transfer flavoprotein subunit beta/FixA family protein [Crenobacter cavernae]|uniref:Electron transfer flavoprotein subunit beta n=1 Tax=Crenobacter cavernae TaxID=2290923 RepID=A0A345Y806_9NEIS|nr:electron transfer flavoprotein subunit beta/FixA family protein [Crenobacter cavernae]AXK40058.1 electron transfer flavoprotein subunit beta/FixA family protein [Crenobacter cavernae]
MKILVAVKRVVDHNVTVRAKADGSGVDVGNVKMSLNPFDEVALEEAIRLKETGRASEVLAVSLGEAACQDVLRHALAMGADRALLVETSAELQPLAVAKVLKAIAEREVPDLVILGKQAIDDDAGQVGQMLAALLGCGQGMFASEIELVDKRVEVTREIDGGSETVSLALPAVVSADLRLNAPRFVKLPSLMMAKKKTIESSSPEELGVDVAPRLKRVKVAEPAPRQTGVKVANVEELIAKLRNEAKVL